MSPRILVAYASVYGSTAVVAKAFGKALQKEGCTIDLAGMKTVSSPKEYDAVVIVAPVYMEKIVGDVKKFVGKHRDALAKVLVAAFCVGVAPHGKDPGDPDIVINILRSAPAPPERIAVTMLKDRHGEALLHAQVDMAEDERAGRGLPGPGGDRCLGGDLFGKPWVRAGP